MKSDRNILIAFLLNLSFSLFELFGGLFTNSVAVLSDAIHDLGDAVGIGVSYALEKKSKKSPDDSHTYGYGRYSVLGSMITTLLLLGGSVTVVVNAVHRILHPQDIHYTGMILLAVVGVAVNLAAAFFTRHGDSMNQKAVNLHMLEDVLGWIVVLVGAIVMRLTDFWLIDPMLSIGVAVFIFIHAWSHLKECLDLFLLKTPQEVTIDEVRRHVLAMDSISDVHHLHIWSIDGTTLCATMHIVTDGDHTAVKAAVKEELHAHGITHATLELESPEEHCADTHCHPQHASHHHHHHH